MKVQGRKTIHRELVFTVHDKWETDLLLRALRREAHYQGTQGNSSEVVLAESMVQQFLKAVSEYR